MIKKLISVSLILTTAMVMGALVDVEKINAAGDDVTFSIATPLAGSLDGIIISAGSTVEEITINDATVEMTLASGSSITFTSATSQEMSLNPAIATTTYSASGSSITVAYDSDNPTVVLSLSGQTYAPVISTVIVTNTTDITVTFDKNIDYVVNEATLIANTTFAGISPASASISGADLVLTFASGALAAAGVKDDSVLVLPSGQIKETTRENTFVGTSTQVVTTLSGINQLYDFVFVIQEGQNFMSVPYDVDTTLANSYVAPGSTTISIQTIGDASGDFATASSYSPLYGYYINSDSADDVYLRLKKTSTPTMTFSRTFSAAGWHMIGMANNFVDDSETNNTDDDVLEAITTNYSTVLDVSTVNGTTGDANGNLTDTGNLGTYYDVGSADVYKALYDTDDIVSSTYALIEEDVASKGIEFNTGEAYFIYISAADVPYVGTAVSDANLVL